VARTHASPAQELAIIDGGSFVLPYDHGLVGGLLRQGNRVAFFASRTRYNAEFLDDLRDTPGVRVLDAAVSGSVAPRWRGVLAYAGLLLKLAQQRQRFHTVNLQFSVLWPLEMPFWWLLRGQLVFTVHNAVPHGFGGLQHAPTRRIASLARQLVFVSAATQEDFMRRYGEAFRAKAALLPHGLLPIAPGAAPQPVRACAKPQALVFWGTVKGYKGVELFAELARSQAWRDSGLALEIHGRWDAELHPLRDELSALGVRIADRYLGAAELHTLMQRPVLFALPYRDASQSGALYTLLHEGCTFICADTGDLGAFMRRHALPELLLTTRSVQAVLAAVNFVRSHAADVAARLQAAQQQSAWDRVLANAARIYSAPEHSARTA
jgi:glycosyltransferase involved in cell wall biosynthesis